MPPKRFMPGRTRTTITQTTPRSSPTLDFSKTVEPGLDVTTEFQKPDQDEYGNKLTDDYGDGCNEYAQNPDWCGNWNTDDFQSKLPPIYRRLFSTSGHSRVAS